MDTDEKNIQMEKRKFTMKDNKYAQKGTRRIELGWLHCESSSLVRQVRSAKGGGTRHLMVSSETTVADVMQSALDMYFPEFSMVNFDQSTVLLTDTISLLYDRKRVKMLRLYLRSQYKDCSDAECNEPSDEPYTQLNDPVHNTVPTVHEERMAAEFVAAGTPTVSHWVPQACVVLPGGLCNSAYFI